MLGPRGSAGTRSIVRSAVGSAAAPSAGGRFTRSGGERSRERTSPACGHPAEPATLAAGVGSWAVTKLQ